MAVGVPVLQIARVRQNYLANIVVNASDQFSVISGQWSVVSNQCSCSNISFRWAVLSSTTLDVLACWATVTGN